MILLLNIKRGWRSVKFCLNNIFVYKSFNFQDTVRYKSQSFQKFISKGVPSLPHLYYFIFAKPQIKRKQIQFFFSVKVG